MALVSALLFQTASPKLLAGRAVVKALGHRPEGRGFEST
jgi:hypothetical protein